MNFGEWRSTRSAPAGLHALAMVAVIARILAAAVLVLGPWTDEAVELDGWDVERFTEIAVSEERPWTETPVEYPPGSVVVFELATSAGQGLSDQARVGTHRVLVMAMLVCDLFTAWMLGRSFGRRAANTYLLAGLPLVPMGLLRLDILTTTLAVVAVVAVFGPNSGQPSRPWRQLVAGAAVTTGAAIKLWPALLIVPLWVLGRRTAASAAVGSGLLAVGLWLLWADVGLEPVSQVLSLRGASGWHVESTGGLITSLVSAVEGNPVEAELELNAYRVGRIRPAVSTLGTVAALGVLVALSRRSRPAAQLTSGETTTSASKRAAGATSAALLGTLATVLATAALFSPQFMLWLTPWAAIAAATDSHSEASSNWMRATPAGLTAAACLITGVVLAAFGPAGVTQPLASSALLIRTAVVAFLPVSCWLWLGLLRPKLADEGSGPGLELANADIDQMAGETQSLGE